MAAVTCNVKHLFVVEPPDGSSDVCNVKRLFVVEPPDGSSDVCEVKRLLDVLLDADNWD